MLITLADVAVGPVIAFGGIILGLAILMFIVLVEAVVMLLTGWGTFGRSFLDALIANAVSTLVGLVLAAVFAGGKLLWLALLLSFALEGGILILLRRHSAGKTWLVALYANVVSYALMYVGAWLLNGL